MESNTSAPAGQPKALQPVSVRARFFGRPTARALAEGRAILSIRDGDGESSYWCEALPAGGYRLKKFGAGRRYDLPADLSSCTCGDRTHRPERPGGCKHMAALRQAAPAVTKASA
jgi:hypothetical protein